MSTSDPGDRSPRAWGTHTLSPPLGPYLPRTHCLRWRWGHPRWPGEGKVTRSQAVRSPLPCLFPWCHGAAPLVCAVLGLTSGLSCPSPSAHPVGFSPPFTGSWIHHLDPGLFHPGCWAPGFCPRLSVPHTATRGGQALLLEIPLLPTLLASSLLPPLGKREAPTRAHQASESTPASSLTSRPTLIPSSTQVQPLDQASSLSQSTLITALPQDLYTRCYSHLDSTS